MSRFVFLLAFVLLSAGCGGGGDKSDGDASGDGATGAGDGTGTAGAAGNDPFTFEGCAAPSPKISTLTTGQGLAALPDGTIVVVGKQVVHPNAGLTSILLTGVAPTGAKLWEELYDEPRVHGALEEPVQCANGNFQEGIDVFPWEDGGLLVAGWVSFCNPASGTKGWLFALDEEQEPVEELVLPGPFQEVVVEPGGGSLVLSGASADKTADTLTWVDDELEVTGEVSVPWPGQQGLGSPGGVALLSGGRIALAATALRPGETDQDLWLALVEPGKGVVAEHWYGSSCNDAVYDIAAHPDGGLVLVAWVDGRIPGHKGPWIARLDSNGEYVYERSLLEGGEIRDVQVLPSGEILMAGGTYDPANPASPPTKSWLVFADADGGRLWSGTYLGATTGTAEAVEVLPQGGYALAGQGGLTLLQPAPAGCQVQNGGVGADEFGCGLFEPNAVKTLAQGDPIMKFQWKLCGSPNSSTFEFTFPNGSPLAGEFCIGEDPIPGGIGAAWEALSPYLWVRPFESFAEPALVYFSAAQLGADPNVVTAVLYNDYAILDGEPGFAPLPGFQSSPASGIVQADATGTGIFVLARPAE